MRFLKASGALLLLVGLLVAVPVLLFTWGNPLVLTRIDWSKALLRPDDGSITLGILALLGWLAWLLLAVTTVGELARVLSRGKISIRLPGTGWLRPVVAALVTAILAPLLAWQATAKAPELVASVSLQETWAPPAAASAAAASAAPAAAADQAVPAKTIGPVHIVQPGEELWSIAQQRLGAGEKWREIVNLNPEINSQTRLEVGMSLQLPLTAFPATAAPAAETDLATGPAMAAAGPGSTDPFAPTAAAKQVEVQAGDSLWKLAAKYLGDPLRWPEIYAANRSQIADPDLIDIGWVLTIPGASLEPEPVLPPTPLPPSSPVQPELSAQPISAATAPPSTVFTPHELRPSLATGSDTQRNFLGPIGALLAAGVVAGVATRRRAQLLRRAVGRRILPVGARVQRFWSVLTKHSLADQLGPSEPAPTTVVLGWRGAELVCHELEVGRCILIDAVPELAAAATGAMLTSLVCAPWSASVEIVAVEPAEDWETALDEPRLSTPESLDAALTALQQQCAQRRIELGNRELSELRSDPDLAAAWQPIIYLFCQPLLASQLAQIGDCLALGQVGISVVATGPAPTNLSHQSLQLPASETASLEAGEAFEPQLVDSPARRALIELFAAATTEDTEPANWWSADLPANVTSLPDPVNPIIEDCAMPALDTGQQRPTLLLLGPVELIGCHGVAPPRAAGQCMEYCAWLLEHPGATPSQMVQDLLVAEGTRRSNMSRLRSWLGRCDDQLYLPEAYSGRIALDAAVTSDWEYFQLLLSGGVNRSSSALLQQALSLVRGQPLGDYGFQWTWAESLRTDMLAMITDATVVLADRALATGNLEVAAWAIGQGQLAVAEDELVAVRQIQLFTLSGDLANRDKAVLKLTRAARNQGRDLQPETIKRLQQALQPTGITSQTS